MQRRRAWESDEFDKTPLPEPLHSLGPDAAAPVSARLGTRRSLQSTAYQLVSESPTESVATAGDCLLVVIRETLSVDGVKAVQSAYEQLQHNYKRVGYFSYI